MSATRQEVYAAIDSEREYQDARWNGTASGGRHSITEFLVYIKDYVEEALHIESREGVLTADPKALNIVRKVAGLAVVTMEQHGAPMR